MIRLFGDRLCQTFTAATGLIFESGINLVLAICKLNSHYIKSFLTVNKPNAKSDWTKLLDRKQTLVHRRGGAAAIPI